MKINAETDIKQANEPLNSVNLLRTKASSVKNSNEKN